MKVKSITFSAVIRMEIGNPNSGYNEDIISTIKKIQHPNGDSYPYISGQSLRRMVRERMKDIGFNNSPKSIDSGKNKSPYSTACDPVKYPDDDLFGYMDAKNGISRTSPVRVSPAIALFPYSYERDLGIQNNADIRQNHRMYETEVSSNWLSYSVLIEVDRVGNGAKEIKNGNELADWEVSIEERVSRIKGLLNSFLYLWGGGKQSRLLTNEGPMVMAISMQTVKNPIWMGRIAIDAGGYLNDDSLDRVTTENSEIIYYSGVGVEQSLIHSKKYTTSPKAVTEAVIERLKGIF
jgi:CRISPR-associated protein Cst2